ncbi:uncharacterized protein BYT42DRAFT_173473 [Radiomyces spectabilis]|uniref:uncharacterized protein n=1 Tax=Radiomyces spectabilis TaxID=64574 RepID=UPI00221F974C|nr:uncharacterized protein BYT42DRAFT_173473 [Radiomyces spectabilis]KAI8390892.1 hypothetical protein BYT42DRAFT_173473 [Radiomyces spectabilis]
MANSDRLRVLLEWFESNGVQWDKEALEIRDVDGSLGVYALNDIAEKKRIVKIPKESILSAKNTGIANIFEDESIEGGCSLSLTVMYEMSQGQESPWYGYLQSLPECADLPILWSDAEKKLLQGTEMEDAVYNDLRDLEDDYKDIVENLLEKYPYIFSPEKKSQYFSFEKFRHVSTLVSSRSFEVDAYHENALVPFADLFNHRSGNEHVHFETDFDVCDACGALEYCEHQYLEFLENGSSDEHEGDDDENWSDVDEEVDLEQESGDDEDDEDEAPDAEDMGDSDEEEEGPLKDLEELEGQGVNFWQNEEEEQEKDTCDIVVDKAVKKGEEVFNTYGDHPNVLLLGKYGFCHDDNKNDYVSVSEDSVIDACLAVTKEAIVAEGQNLSSEALEEAAVERTRPRWEFFLMNEAVLCPSEDSDDEEEEDDFDESMMDDEKLDEEDNEEDEEHGCCGDDHDHDHDHDHDEHEHSGGCCDDDGCMDGDQKSRPYFMNSEGLYEDGLMCLLHVMFVNEGIFAEWVDDVSKAVNYFSDLEGSQKPKRSKDLNVTKKHVYSVCRLLSEERGSELAPIEKEMAARDKTKNKREYYALTCRINEKRITEKSIAYYQSMMESGDAEKKASSGKANKKMKM